MHRFSAYVCHSPLLPILAYLIKVRFLITWEAWSMMDRMSPSLPPASGHMSILKVRLLILFTSLTSAQFFRYSQFGLTAFVSHQDVWSHYARGARRQHVRTSTRALTCTRSKSAMQHGCVACVAADTRRPRSMAMRISKTCTCDDDVGFCGCCRCRRPSVAVADGSFCCCCTGRASGLARRFLRS